MVLMKMTWLRQTGAEELILVFTGWAVGAAPFRHLTGSSDVLLLSDYRDLTCPALPSGTYRRISLVAYSFGVAAACHLAPQIGPFARSTAISGTATPADDTTGIPPETIRQTEAHLTEVSLRQFARRAGCALEAPADIPALQAELRAVAGRQPAPPLRFDRIWLGHRDRVFPPENLARAWAGQAAQQHWLDCGHNPLALLTQWDEVLA
jgi:pimeloyl-[acyl-carrier protein] methyl ester esterase